MIDQANSNSNNFSKQRKSIHENVQTNLGEMANSSIKILQDNNDSQELNKSQIINFLNTSKDFTQLTSRHSSSVIKSRKNPFGNKRSLPEITQKSSTNAANILMIDK